MLKELYIENLAVISKENIEFGEKLNIFTGETGAGKSIIINGINAILGQRKSKDIVRTGTQKAVITALFTDINKSTISVLNELGYTSVDNELTISREISADGGSVARVNSRPITVTALKQIGETLINIHGQHDSQILLSPEKHIDIIDSFAGNEKLICEYREIFKELQDTAREIKKVTINERDKSIRISELEEIIEEISSLDLDESEDDDIEAEFSIAKNSSALLKLLNTSYGALNGVDSDSGAVAMTDEAHGELLYASEIMPELEETVNRLKAAAIELDDIASDILSFTDKIDIDQARLEYITARRDEIIKIKRKYGPELTDVLSLLEKSELELNGLQDSVNSLSKLNEKKLTLLDSVTKKAKELSTAREKAGLAFIKCVTEELKFLDMPNVKFEIKHDKGKLTFNGMDYMEFLISANIGETPKPISKIASGGELSRIMLALKSVIADKDEVDTLIFDEIDTGVSGRAAQKIGIKLGGISKNRQVICVTHLAQIAVMSDNHLFIEKNTIDNRTVTTVKPLDFKEKVKEIARIMGGDNLTDLMLENAEQMIIDNKA